MSGTNGQFLFGAPVAVDGWDFTESTANDESTAGAGGDAVQY